MTNEPVAHVRVRAGGRVDDVVCVAVEPGVPVSWLRSADVLLLPEDSDRTAQQLFLRFPGCSVVVVTALPPTGPPFRTPSHGGTRNLVHVRGGAAPPAAVSGDPRTVGALAHARRSRAHASAEGAGSARHDRAVVVSAVAPRAD